jgi:O-antigen/teichoic acid export membrane protein
MVTLAGCSESLLFAWTGNLEVTLAASPVLRLYALGNGLLALGAFPFYLQYARGNLRWHLIGNIGMVVLLIPILVVAATYFGGVGAGWVWLTMNALYLFGWVAYVHGRLEPGMHKEWITKNVLAIMLPTVAVGTALSLLFPPVLNQRALAFVHVTIFAITCFATAGLSSSLIRSRLELFIRPRCV